MRLAMVDGGDGGGEPLGILVDLPVRFHDALGSAVASVEAGNRFLCHPVVTFLQVGFAFGCYPHTYLGRIWPCCYLHALA